MSTTGTHSTAPKEDIWSMDTSIDQMFGEGQKFEWNDKVWTLRPIVPNLLFLKLGQQHHKDPDYQLTVEEQLKIARAVLYPASQLDDMIDEGFSTVHLASFITFAQAAYSVANPLEHMKTLYAVKADPEAHVQEAVSLGKPRRTRNTSTGRSSKATSSPSTG
jgi:hypothetical protein